jgi:hypothetical protein
MVGETVGYIRLVTVHSVEARRSLGKTNGIYLS